jgi:hypothetical protein
VAGIAGKPVCEGPSRINHLSRFVPTLDTAMRGMMSVCSIVISAQSEAPRSPDRHLVDHDGSGRGGLRLWSRRVSLRNHEENPVAGESGPTPPQFHRRAGPPIPCGRHVSIRTPEDEDVGAAGAVAATPQNDGASQEGATPKPGAVRGTQWAALGTLAFRVGRRVRISFAPAASQQRTRPFRRSSKFVDEGEGSR